MRRLDAAIDAARKALEIDPLSALIQWQLGHRYFYNEQWDRAIEHFRNALELDPQYNQAYLMMGILQVMTGKLDEGIQACEMGLRLGGRIPVNLTELGAAYLLAGRQDDARKILAELLEFGKTAYLLPMAPAYIYILLGELDRAFDWLERAVDEHDGMIINIIAFRLFYEPLLSHPRYRALMRRMNLES